MKLKAISSSVLLALLPVSGVYAAAMDRSGQSISAFLQPNNYFEGGISILDPSVSGKNAVGEKISDMGEDYYFPSAALKIQATDNISLGLIYDQPFGADAHYSDGIMILPARAGGNKNLSGTDVEVKTNNLTALIGFQPNKNINIYAGAAYQDVKGSIKLASIPYEAKLSKDDSFGWLVGAAYQIPDIALKVALTYRSEIEHELETQESLLGGAFSTSKDTKVKTPQSLNLDFQTGIMANTEPYRVCRRVNILRDYSDEKTKLYPRN